MRRQSTGNQTSVIVSLFWCTVECSGGCNDAGECLSLRDLSRRYAVESETLYDSVWDNDMMFGCKCSKGRYGYDCSKRETSSLTFSHRDLVKQGGALTQTHYQARVLAVTTR